MQTALLATLLFVLLGLHTGLTCSPVTADGLSFCFQNLPSGAFNDHNSSLTAVLQAFDALAALTWPSVENAVQAAAAQHGFTVCEDCLTALRHMTCSSLVPGCNYGACILNVSVQLYEAYFTCAGIAESDAQACYQQGYGSDACQTFLAKVYAAAADSYDLAICMRLKQAAILNKDQCFRSQIIGKAMCEQFVDVCLCSPSQTVKDDVCAYFPAEGYTIDFPAGLSCSSSSNWCANTNNKRAVGSTGANQACPNNHVCLSVSQSNDYAATSSSVSTDAGAASLPSSFLVSFFSSFF